MPLTWYMHEWYKENYYTSMEHLRENISGDTCLNPDWGDY